MALAACTDTLDEAAVPKPLSVAVNARDITARAPIHGTALPDASNIGISLVTEDGTPYDGVAYDNLKYTAAGTAPDQSWSTPNVPTLSSNPAKLVAYYPWAENTDYSAVPVETDTQTDYMYSQWLTGLSNANPNANIVMKHALTAVRVALVKGDFTADVDVSSVSVKSPAFATAGSLDTTTGSLSGLTGIGDAVTVAADFPLTAQATNVEVMAVPDVSVSSGVTTVTTQIGDRKYSVNINFTENYKQGYIYTYTLTLNNTGMEVTSVAVTPWEEGTTDNGELGVVLDNKYIVEIEVEEADTEYAHNVYGFTGTIDWGDGSTTTYDQLIGWPSHTYATAGKYTVTATGQCMALTQAIYENGSFVDTDLLLSRLAWGDYIPYVPAFITQLIHIGGDMGITDMSDAFAYQTKLTEIPADIFNELTEIVSFKGTLAHCTNLTSIPEGLFDNNTKVTDFTFTFSSCTALTEIPAGLFDKCTEVTGFKGTFATCTALKNIPEGLFDNNTKVTSFGNTGNGYGCFGRCKSITEIPEGLFDKCPEVTSFQNAFNGTGITSIPAGLFDKCTEVTNFKGVFANCSNLKGEIPEGLFDNNTKVTDFGATFQSCSGLTGSIPKGLFDNCTEVTSFAGTFLGCKKLTSIPEGLFDNCTEVTNFRDTFFNCTSLKEISTALFDNNIKVTTFQGTFSGCEGLTSIPQGLFDKCTEVTNFGSTFYSCKNLTNIPEGLVDNCTKVTEFGMFFGGCLGLTSIPAGLFDNCPEVIAFSGTFKECFKLKMIPSGLFDNCTKVINFKETFAESNSISEESPYTIINVDGNDVKVHLYERSLYPVHFAAPTSYTSCFKNCTGIIDYSTIVAAGWN